MKTKFTKYLILLLIVIGCIAFLRFGRKAYSPIIRKIQGNQTVESVLSRIETSVYQRLRPKLNQIGLSKFPTKIQLLAFKKERILEVYAWKDNQFKRLTSYPFTGFSGQLGPKLKEGDRQIPEGIYKIDHLNPNSSYYLSMKVNYPNSFDKQKAKLDGRHSLGDDIFIHGKDLTIGCIPIGDEAIEELFVLSKYAFNKGIEVIISPIDFRKNKKFPSIENISWEEEIYQKISERLHSY